jgi:hypothetical protein
LDATILGDIARRSVRMRRLFPAVSSAMPQPISTDIKRRSLARVRDVRGNDCYPAVRYFPLSSGSVERGDEHPSIYLYFRDPSAPARVMVP